MLLGLFLISHVFKYSYYTPLKMLLNVSFEAILTHVAFGDVSLFDMSFCVCTLYTNTNITCWRKYHGADKTYFC